MEAAHVMPRKVRVQVTPADCEGLAVTLRFEASRKNHFDYPAFVDADGVAEIAGEELLRWFKATASMFQMDYLNVQSVFTGRITAEVLSNARLKGAVEALALFQDFVEYPDGYKEHLEAAAERGQDPAAFRVLVTADY